MPTTTHPRLVPALDSVIDAMTRQPLPGVAATDQSIVLGVLREIHDAVVDPDVRAEPAAAVLMCDTCLNACVQGPSDGRAGDDALRALRTRAHAEGWRIVGESDVCPACADRVRAATT